MGNWKTCLKADPTEWLLEGDNPSVRYLALTELLDVPGKDASAQKTMKNIMRTGVVPRLLAKQETGGYWDRPERMYVAKYKGTVWQLIVLAEHLADGRDKRIRGACEFLLDHSQDVESGGFSMHESVKTGGGRHSEVIPCLTGNMVWSLIRLGYAEDPGLQRGVDWITRYQRFDDGVSKAPKGWPYEKAEPCWGMHTCHMGVVKGIKALAEVPQSMMSRDIRNMLDAGVEYILRHHIHKRSHDISKVSKPGWTRFGFPLMYQTDVLEILEILTRLGCRDERMQEAVRLVVSKQDASGRWSLANTFNGRFQVDVEKKGQPSKWITLKALMVLRRYYG